MFCGFIDWLREHARKVDKMARSDVAGVQIRSTRFARIRRHVLERRSANCYFWIGKLGDSVRRGLAEEESESERLAASLTRLCGLFGCGLVGMAGCWLRLIGQVVE